MKLRCNPGDLAIIVKAFNDSNVGKLVRVVEPWGGREHYGGTRWSKKADKHEWLVESIGLPLKTNIGTRHQSGPMSDSQLQPIRGEENHSETERQLELTA